MEAFCFKCQHMDCLYTIFKYPFNGKTVVKSGKLFDNVQRSVISNHQNRRVDKMPSIAKRKLLRKKFKKHLLSSFQKTKTTETSESVFQDKIEQVEKTQFQLQQIKIVDWFLDDHGIYTSNLVSFKRKSF